MEIHEIVEEPGGGPQAPTGAAVLGEQPKIAVAVGRGHSSSHALQWLLDNHLVSGGHEAVHLLHVQAPIRFVPTPMGNTIPVNQASEDVVSDVKLKRFIETERLLHRYKAMCDDKQVISEVCCSEGELVHKELVSQILNLCIVKLVLGTSSRSKMTKAFKGAGIASLVAKHAPDFCTVMVVCNGKLHSVREATVPWQP